MTLPCYQHYAFTRKTKYDYVSANFKNVLTVRWYFSYISFSCTMLYCIRVFKLLLKVIYLSRLDFKPVNFLRVCCPNDLVVGSLGNAIKIFGNPWDVSCYCSAWTTVFTGKFLECFQKSLFSLGLTYL